MKNFKKIGCSGCKYWSGRTCIKFSFDEKDINQFKVIYYKNYKEIDGEMQAIPGWVSRRLVGHCPVKEPRRTRRAGVR